MKICTDTCVKNATWMVEAFVETIQNMLAFGRRVVLMYPVPETGFHTQQYVQNRLSNRNKTIVTTSYEAFQRRCDMILTVGCDFVLPFCSLSQAFDNIV